MSGRFLILFIGLCQWVYAFILTVCVTMSNDHTSPEIQISFSNKADTERTVLLILLIVLSWIGAYAFMARRRWAWFYTGLLGIFLLGVGLYSHWTNDGPLEAFVGTGSLRHTTGLVVASLAAIALVVLPFPSTRRQFFGD
jgi:hypothetical protein